MEAEQVEEEEMDDGMDVDDSKEDREMRNRRRDYDDSTLCCHDVSFDLQVTSCGDGELDDASEGVVASEEV